MQTLKANISLRKRLTLVGLVLFFSVGVYGQAPVASLTASAYYGCPGMNVVFTNSSINAVSYSWNFGNGNTPVSLNSTWKLRIQLRL